MKYQTKPINIRQIPKIFNKSSNQFQFHIRKSTSNIKKTHVLIKKVLVSINMYQIGLYSGIILPCLFPCGASAVSTNHFGASCRLQPQVTLLGRLTLHPGPSEIGSATDNSHQFVFCLANTIGIGQYLYEQQYQYQQLYEYQYQYRQRIQIGNYIDYY